MSYKKGIIIKLISSMFILILALNFEKALGSRFYYFVIMGLGYFSVTLLRIFVLRNKLYIFISFILEILIIFILESLSRYIINYPIHILYIITLIETAFLVDRKKLRYFSLIMLALSSYKFVNQILLSRSYTKIGESVFFILITFFIILIIYLLKYIQMEKENTELIYEELKIAYDNLKTQQVGIETNTQENEKILSLTDREREICYLIAQGKNNKEISKELYLSEGTVKNHITNIFNKLELRDRTQLAVYSLKNKID
ncbi:MAG: response regulator transcription factor [Bacillota bacterium]|nr:response regulator transcription factor [Bacillota bacterium]